SRRMERSPASRSPTTVPESIAPLRWCCSTGLFVLTAHAPATGLVWAYRLPVQLQKLTRERSDCFPPKSARSSSSQFQFGPLDGRQRIGFLDNDQCLNDLRP